MSATAFINILTAWHNIYQYQVPGIYLYHKQKKERKTPPGTQNFDSKAYISITSKRERERKKNNSRYRVSRHRVLSVATDAAAAATIKTH